MCAIWKQRVKVHDYARCHVTLSTQTVHTVAVLLDRGSLAYKMEEYFFNVDNGYLEGLVRGFRSGILSRTDYINLVQCETIEGELTISNWC